MSKILITGVAGFIGSHVARRFRDAGCEVIGVDDLSSGKQENIPEGIEFIRGDLTDSEFVLRLPNQCELILHLAGQSSGEISFNDPVSDLRKNTVSTLNLIHYGINNDSERIVYASSMSVYGSVPDIPVPETYPCTPLSCYGVGKLASENYLRVYSGQLSYVTLRMFNVYGPGQDLNNLHQGMVSIYLAQALTSRNIEIKGNLERFRDFIYIEDVVEAWFQAAFSAEVLNRELNVGTGSRTTVETLIKHIEVAIPGTTHFTSDPTPGDQLGIYADSRLLKSTLPIKEFVSFDDGLMKFIKLLS